MDISSFIQIEKKYDLYHVEIEGINPWMYFRFPFWNFRLCKDTLGLADNLQKSAGVMPYIYQFASAINILLRCNRRRLRKADIILYAHSRRIKSDGYFECIYTDWLAEKYRYVTVMEDPYMHRHITPVRPKHIYYTDLLQIKSVLRGKLHKYMKTGKYRAIYAQIQKGFSAALEEIRGAYSFGGSDHVIYDELTRIVLEIQVLKEELRLVLEKVQPKLIVEIVSYNKRCMALNELAKGKGIFTIELQHGTMHKDHAAYQFSHGCGEISQFPDFVFLFSEYWKNCANLPISDERIKVTGFPYFERQLHKYQKADAGNEKRVNIIFISQGTIGRQMSQMAAELCELLESDRYHIIYKLHPGEYEGWKKRNPELLKENIEVIDSFEHNIYEYFSVCHVQVGVYSTAIYEGLAFGLATYIYDIGHADTMEELCSQGYAVYVKDAKELYGHLRTDRISRDINGKKFWKANAVENICREIDELLEKN